MKNFLLAVLVFLAASPGWSKPTLSVNYPLGAIRGTFTFDTTTEPSPLFGPSGLCTATFVRAGSETVTLYQTTAGTATGGASIGAFSATTTTPTTLAYGQPNLYAVSNGATGGGKLTIHCSPTQVSASGGGGVTETLAASLPVTGDSSLIYRITDATNGSDCDNIGGGAEQADCRWNGSTYEPTSQGTAGLANVVEDVTPDLGGPLNAGGFDITNIGDGSIVALDQVAGEADQRYDSAENFYYLDRNADGDRDTSTLEGSPWFGDREVGIGVSDDIFPEEFGGSIQNAINHACTVAGASDTRYGGVVRLQGRRYNTPASTITIPAGCHGLTIQGAGPSIGNNSYTPGTLLFSDQTGAGFPVFTVSASVRNFKISDLAIALDNPQAGTIGITFLGGNAQPVIERTYIATTTAGGPAASTVGIGIKMTDVDSASINDNIVLGPGIAILQTGTAASGGTVYKNNDITANSDNGIGVKIGEANNACSNVHFHGNTIQGNDTGVLINTTTSECLVSFVGNHFENGQALGGGSHDIVASGNNAVTSVGDYFGPGVHITYSFHRTSQTSTRAVDVFAGTSLYKIQMDAGSCAFVFPAVWNVASTIGGASGCNKFTVDGSGMYLDTNGDNDFDAASDLRLNDSTLIDIADGTIAENLVNTANPWAVNEGGTGAATFTANAVLLGNTTSAIAASAVTIASGAVDGVTTLDADGAVTAPSFTAEAAAVPSVTFDDSDWTGTESRITGDAATDNNGTLTLEVETAAGVFTPMLKITSVAGTAAMELGRSGAAYLQVDPGGILSGVGGGFVDAASVGENNFNLGPDYTMQAQRPTSFSAAPGTLTADQVEGHFYGVTGTTTINLPTASSNGLEACFYAIGAVTITLNPANGDFIRLVGTETTANDGLSIGNAGVSGETICLISRDNVNSDEWIAINKSGTWTVGS